MKSRISNAITTHLRYFFKSESLSGVLLLICAIAALIIANTNISADYYKFLHSYLTIGYKNLSLSMSILHWINDGLMTIFFFVVGMEIKSEMLVGELKSVKQAILPIAAAVGGMVFPAVIYAAFNYNQQTISGWGIPMATDIAFALGVLSVIGSNRAPAGVAVFLTALAIVDDLGAIIVIAIFYTNEVLWINLFMALIILVVLIALNNFKIQRYWILIILGIILWITILKSGIHATIAGVLLAMTVPAKSHKGIFENSMLWKLEHKLAPISSYIIMPIFALANAGVSIKIDDIPKTLASPVSLGILFGLFIGKQLGIFGMSYLLIYFKLAILPRKVTLKHIYGAGLLGGIGFTMSLFVSSLSFQGEEFLSIAKMSIILASVLSAISGVMFFSTIRYNNIDEQGDEI